MPPIEFLRRKQKRSISSDVLKTSPVLNLREGEQIIVTYTSAADKMKIFSAWIRDGIENGDAVIYSYPDEESGTIRTKLKEHGINVGKHEKDGTLCMMSLSEHFMSNGRLDYEKAVSAALSLWTEAKRKGYKHVRSIQDVGDFSSFNGQWQEYIKSYWLDPRWDDPKVSEWVESKEPVGIVYKPFIIDITAINVERMTEREISELLKTFGQGTLIPARFIDLFQYMNLFSKSLGLDHEQLTGRKILLEFDPLSNYEKAIDDLVKESLANVEPIFIFTPSKSPLHTHLAKQLRVKFFLTSTSTSSLVSASQSEVLLPAKDTSLMLDALGKVLETHAHTHVSFVFDILSELLTSVGQEKTFTFLRYVLDMLSSENITGLFLLNSGAHEPEVVSLIRELFPSLLTYDKNGLRVTKHLVSIKA